LNPESIVTMPTTHLSKISWKFPPAAAMSRLAIGNPTSLELPFKVLGQKGFSLKSPLILRQVPWSQFSRDTCAAICTAARQLGIAVSAPISLLEQLPAVSVPPRIAQVWTDSCPTASELELSDLIEVNLTSERSGNALALRQTPSADSHLPWPIDVPDAARLKSRLQMLREVTGNRTPIGLVINSCHVAEDVMLAISAAADFIILQWNLNPLSDQDREIFPTTDVAIALTTARRTLQEAKAHTTTLIVDCPIEAAVDFPKLFALGANCWCCQSAALSMLKPAPTTPSYQMGGSFGGVASSTPKANPQQSQIVEKLQRLLQSLVYVLQRSGKNAVHELDFEDLQTTDLNLAHWTGIATP
jgi:hypothetical protein